MTWLARRLRRLGNVVWIFALLVCFGAMGLIGLLPPVRRRGRERAAHCATCRHHRIVWRIFVAGFLVLLAVGAAVRAHAAITSPWLCNSHVWRTPDGSFRVLQPEAEIRMPMPRGWAVTRSVVTAPSSGLALLVANSLDMERCDGGPLLATFWLPPRTSGGGTVIGDVFFAWMPPRGADADLPESFRGFGLAEESTYLRFGPNIHPDPEDVQRLARHVDQWTVFTLAGGPLAFPVSYFADSAFFPFSRNHFERDAGLEDGGYPIPTDYGPAPLWGVLVPVGAALLILFRTRLRRLSRALAMGRSGFVACRPGRCPRHTPGWFRSSG